MTDSQYRQIMAVLEKLGAKINEGADRMEARMSEEMGEEELKREKIKEIFQAYLDPHANDTSGMEVFELQQILSGLEQRVARLEDLINTLLEGRR